VFDCRFGICLGFGNWDLGFPSSAAQPRLPSDLVLRPHPLHYPPRYLLPGLPLRLHPRLNLSLILSLHLHPHLSLSPSLCLRLHLRPCLRLSLNLNLYLCLSLYPRLYPGLNLSLDLPPNLRLYQRLRLNLNLSFCLRLCLCVYQRLHLRQFLTGQRQSSRGLRSNSETPTAGRLGVVAHAESLRFRLKTWRPACGRHAQSNAVYQRCSGRMNNPRPATALSQSTPGRSASPTRAFFGGGVPL